MQQPMWPQQPPPPIPGDSAVLGDWVLATPLDLTAARRRLRTLLEHGAGAADPTASRDRGGEPGLLLLTVDELAANALRHGRRPVRATVTRLGCGWLVDVTDAAPDRPPTPATGTGDPARGGLGLQLVAQLCTVYGWSRSEGRKHVWACLPDASQ